MVFGEHCRLDLGDGRGWGRIKLFGVYHWRDVCLWIGFGNSLGLSR